MFCFYTFSVEFAAKFCHIKWTSNKARLKMPAGYIYIDIFVSAVERNANESPSCMNSLMDQNIQISLLLMKSLIQLVANT